MNEEKIMDKPHAYRTEGAEGVPVVRVDRQPGRRGMGAMFPSTEIADALVVLANSDSHTISLAIDVLIQAHAYHWRAEDAEAETNPCCEECGHDDDLRQTDDGWVCRVAWPCWIRQHFASVKGATFGPMELTCDEMGCAWCNADDPEEFMLDAVDAVYNPERTSFSHEEADGLNHLLWYVCGWRCLAELADALASVLH